MCSLFYLFNLSVCLKFFIIQSWEEKTNDQQFILNIANGFSQIKKCGIYIVLKFKKKNTKNLQLS